MVHVQLLWLSVFALFVSRGVSGLWEEMDDAVSDGDSDTSNTYIRSPKHSSIKLRAPDLDNLNKPWFNPEKALGHLAEVNARMKVVMRAPFVDESDSTGVDTLTDRVSREYGKRLREDSDRSNKLTKDIERINRRIQAEPIIGQSFESDPYSFLERQLTKHGRDANATLETEASDWTYCSCDGTGPNGTLVLPNREYPPSPVQNAIGTVSLLQLHVKGRLMALKRNPACDCMNPWSNYSDGSNSSTCTVTPTEVTICLIHVNGSSYKLSVEEVQAEAQDLIKAIDDAFGSSPPMAQQPTTSSDSFVELWHPYVFQ